MPNSTLLIYLMRHDLRLDDNPIFNEISTRKYGQYTHLLPLYVFAAEQLEVSGFIPEDSGKKSPYREARSAIGNFWRCGPLRAKFLAESVWDLKETLDGVGSRLEIRVGMLGEVVTNLLDSCSKEDGEDGMKVGGVWMVGEEGVEEKRQERDVESACKKAGIEFKLFTDEKYFIDDRDIPFTNPDDLPDNFTAYRKMVEPLRMAPRAVLPAPAKSSLLPPPSSDSIPAQHEPFIIPSTYADLETALLSPVRDLQIINPPTYPSGTESGHDFHGGSRPARERLTHIISSSIVYSYYKTRNGLLGANFSTKLSAWLALGCITARQIHEALLNFEDGKTDLGSSQEGYGTGAKTKATDGIRFELLWRDYMRLCTRKFGPKLFRLSGIREDFSYPWKSPSNPRELSVAEVNKILQRWLNGTTGMGLIDAAQRELYLTGYTSNRTRQNVASFLTKHLGLDWRLGAEWYECCLVDYDLSSNWGNWQYVSGVGADPRPDRQFNPVKQAYDYDPRAEYVKAWIPELRVIEEPAQAFQAWEIPPARRTELGLAKLEWVERPLKRINFVVGRRPNPASRSRGNNRRSSDSYSAGAGGGGGGGSAGSSPDSAQVVGSPNPGSISSYRGQGYGNRRGRGRGAYGGSSRGHAGAYGGRYISGGGSREKRMGMVERDVQARQADGFAT